VIIVPHLCCLPWSFCWALTLTAGACLLSGSHGVSHNTMSTVHTRSSKGVFIATQLNSTDPIEQRTAKSVVFLFMTSRPTNWVNCCSRYERVDNSTSSWVQLSWVELCRYKHPLRHQLMTLHFTYLHQTLVTSSRILTLGVADILDWLSIVSIVITGGQ